MRIFILAAFAFALSAIHAPAALAQDLRLTSAEISAGGSIANDQAFNEFGCKGANISPSLSWTGAPQAAKSFAVTLYDPDAPTGRGWWHWVVADIPAGTTALPKNAGNAGAKLMPSGAVQSRNDFGTLGYGGPCPPPGARHHYVLTLFAVGADKLAGASNGGAPAALAGLVQSHSLGKASLIATYGR
jgi:Raf kinase inhibitor-like YbhB/YbcL family protein